jgi:hypothetical protein
MVKREFGMGSIKYQFPGERPEINTFGIHIPDESDLGTGTFTTSFSPKAFSSPEQVSSIIVNPHIFGIFAALDPNSGVVGVRLHEADGITPKDELGFHIAPGLNRDIAHTLVVEFVKWHILSASIDGLPLAVMDAYSSH